MKLWLIFLISTCLFAEIPQITNKSLSSSTTASGGSPITGSFGTAVLTGMRAQAPTHIQVVNQTTTMISFISDQAVPGVAPSNTDGHRIYVLPSSTNSLDGANFLYDNIWIQSEGASITSGSVQVHVW